MAGFLMKDITHVQVEYLPKNTSLGWYDEHYNRNFDKRDAPLLKQNHIVPMNQLRLFDKTQNSLDFRRRMAHDATRF